MLLIHANCDVVENPLVLRVDKKISHLVEPETIERLQAAISELCTEAFEASIEYEKVENTPFQN